LRALVDRSSESIAESIPTVKRATPGFLGDIFHGNLSGFAFAALPLSRIADICRFEARITDDA